LSAGSTTKTTGDEGTILSDQEGASSELSRIKRRLKKLDINSVDEQMSSANKFESPKSHKTLKKRRYR
jgi:hypothetical protein